MSQRSCDRWNLVMNGGADWEGREKGGRGEKRESGRGEGGGRAGAGRERGGGPRGGGWGGGVCGSGRRKGGRPVLFVSNSALGLSYGHGMRINYYADLHFYYI